MIINRNHNHEHDHDHSAMTMTMTTAMTITLRYPPLTFFKPYERRITLQYDGVEFSVLVVRPTFPT